MPTTRILMFALAGLAGVACSSNTTSGSPPPPAVASFAVGSLHDCAVLTSGAVWCWGHNGVGELGVPPNPLSNRSFVPVLAASVTSPAEIAAGMDFSCIRLAAGGVSCWGWGTSGQLGNPDRLSSVAPVLVSNLTGAVDLDVGENHACAIVGGGSVRCWGSNLSGQLGDPALATTAPNNWSAVPVTVPGINAVAVATGGYHTCALLTGGTVKCWGGPFNGPAPYQNDPVAITSLSDVTALSAGQAHDCALILGGRVKCWARNDVGQLGNDTVDPSGVHSTDAVFVSSIESATAVTSGRDHSCALLAGGTVKCWGANASFQLGDGTRTNRSTPVPVAGLTGAIAIGAGDFHTCAIVTGGQVKCWGDNGLGQLGVDPASVPTSAVPVTVGF